MPKGFLPAYSVNTVAEAERLLTAACPVNYSGDYFVPELAREQTLENLYAFGDRLHQIYTDRHEYMTTGIHRATLKAPAKNVTGDVSLYVCTVCGGEATSLALLAQRPCQFPDPAKR